MPKQPTKKRNQPDNQRTWLWLSGGIVLVSLFIVLLWNLPRTSTASPPPATPLATAPPTRPARPASAPAGIVDYCKASPKFRDTLGFSARSLLSTAERGVKGAILIEPAENGQPVRTYQHPSWDDAGYLGHVVLTRNGDVYAFPAPYVSLIDNPPEIQNIIYRIDSTTQEMTRAITLTAATSPSEQNPFGLMGLAYDCDSESLYAASVAGSTRSAEVGKIVRIDLPTQQVVFEYQNIDAFGLGLYIGPTGKRLYYGATRAAEVYSIAVAEQGDLTGEPQLELAIPDANFKARRIIFDRDGTMQLRTRPFDYNLIATSERPEKAYRFQYDATSKMWREVPTP